MLVSMETGPVAARYAWARLVGLSSLAGTQVLVDANSPLCPRGWIGIVALDGTVTVSVPRLTLRAAVREALRGLTSKEATSPAIVQPRLPPTRMVLGPAYLFYPPAGFRSAQQGRVEEASESEVNVLCAASTPEELVESGLLEITSPAFASRTREGELAAVCGFRRWPNGVAHLSVLVHPSYRRHGHGRHAAAVAIARAIDEELLPQWRARPCASQALARSLGLIQVGAQLSLEPA